jgi:MoaA/NifB/PqqE/SkfB family radical SAM enzyme
MKNFKTAQTALEMIAAGHSVETVMNITGLELNELEAILDRELGVKAHAIEYILQVIDTESLGEIELNVN